MILKEIIDSLEDKLKWEEKLKNDEAKSCYIGIGTNKDGNHIFHIDTDKLKKYFIRICTNMQ